MMYLSAYPPTPTLPLEGGGSNECHTLFPSPLRGEGQGGGDYA